MRLIFRIVTVEQHEDGTTTETPTGQWLGAEYGGPGQDVPAAGQEREALQERLAQTYELEAPLAVRALELPDDGFDPRGPAETWLSEGQQEPPPPEIDIAALKV